MEQVTMQELQTIVANLEVKHQVVDLNPSYNGGQPFTMSNEDQSAIAISGGIPGLAHYEGTKQEREAAMVAAIREQFNMRVELWRELAAAYGSTMNHPSMVFMPPQGDHLAWTEFLSLRNSIIAALALRAQSGQPLRYERHAEGFVFYPASGVKLESENLSIPVTLTEVVTIPAHVGAVLFEQGGYESLLSEIVGAIPKRDENLHVHSGDEQTDAADPLERDIVASLDALLQTDRLEAANNKSPVPIMDDPNEATRDYLGFEEYLSVMRRLHQYEEMPNEHKLQFDQAITYRWRDIKALRTILHDIEGNPSGTALTRYNKEMQLLSNRLDQSYLEQHMLRGAIKAEIELLDKKIKQLKKEGKKTSSGWLLMIRSRFEQYLQVMGPMDPSSVDVLTRMHILLKEGDAHIAHLNRGFVEEAKYHIDQFKLHAETNPDLALEHRQRAQSLLERTRWPIPEAPKEETKVDEDTVDTVVDAVNADLPEAAIRDLEPVGESLGTAPAPDFLTTAGE